MAQAGKLVVVATDPATQLREAIAQNAALDLSLDVKHFALGARADVIIRALTILSVEALTWELWFYRTGQYDAAPIASNRWIGYQNFGSSPVRIGAAGLYHYYVNSLAIPYQDEDASSRIHLSLINRSAASKTAGDGGAIKLEITVEPTLGW
jgi:hypothetical protein